LPDALTPPEKAKVRLGGGEDKLRAGPSDTDAPRDLQSRHCLLFSEWISVKTELIDRIYESAFVPDLWPGVLDELAQLTVSRGGVLFSACDRVLKWAASEKLNNIFRSYVEDGWFKRCPRRICLFGRSLPGFFVEQDFWTPDQLDSNPIYYY